MKIFIPHAQPRWTAVSDHHRTKGFSLFELMIVVAVIAVLAAIALPSFVGTIERYRIAAARDMLVGSINAARMEAIRHGRPVVIMQNNAACSVVPTATSEWSCGWMAFVDENSDNAFDASEKILQTVSEPKGVAITHPVGNTAVSLTVSRWGQPGLVGDRFIFFPYGKGIGSINTQTLCINAGGRLRNVAGSPVCS